MKSQYEAEVGNQVSGLTSGDDHVDLVEVGWKFFVERHNCGWVAWSV